MGEVWLHDGCVFVGMVKTGNVCEKIDILSVSNT